MAKRLEDLPNHPIPNLSLLVICACGCGEICNDSGDWVTVEGMHFVEESHWAEMYEAKISGETITFWDGERMDYDQWRKGVKVHG